MMIEKLIVVALCLIILGIALPIYTGTFFKMSKEEKKMYLDQIKQGNKAWLIDYQFQKFIHKYWISISLLGLILFIFSMLIGFILSN